MRLFFIWSFLILSYSTIAQSFGDLIIINESCQNFEIIKDTVFYSDSLFKAKNEGILAEGNLPPEFPGGESALVEFFKNNVIYPEMAIKDKFEGKVIMAFSITPEGCIGRLRIWNNVRSDIVVECIRVLKILPRFKPATSITWSKNGWYWMPVPIWYSVPLNFSLGDDKGKTGIIIKPKTQISLDRKN